MPTDRLAEFEALEARAAEERVAYYLALRKAETSGENSRLLDVGCGNGYGVAVWRRNGLRAFGVDRSLYRLSRWVAEGRAPGPLLVADAAHLPFRDQTFETVVSSGMIEHVGVRESSNPYTVTAEPGQREARLRVVCELLRVSEPIGATFVDCPNGSFPIDFWHGDRAGAFRLHGLPDALLPSYPDFLWWGRQGGFEVRLQPLRGRLSFRQIGHRWWGRVLRPLAAGTLRLLDGVGAAGLRGLAGRLTPYLVLRLRPSRQEP